MRRNDQKASPDSRGPDFGEKPVAVKSLGASSVDLGFEPFAELFISGAFP